MEIWKPIPGWEDSYEVSDHGNVRSIARVTQARLGVNRMVRSKILRQCNDKGYRKVYLYSGGVKTSAAVHRLVAAAFIGVRPEGLQTCHNDGNPSNNHVSNLRYDTPSANQHDRKRHGTAENGSFKGTDNIKAKLNDDQVRLVRKLKPGTLSAVARHWGIDSHAFSRIRTGKGWSHV